MTLPTLCPCPRCSRHVRTSESSCPFCGVGVRFRVEPPLLRGRLDRLRREAQWAFGASLFGFVTASCQPEQRNAERTLPRAAAAGESKASEPLGEPNAVPSDAGALDASPDDAATSDAEPNDAATLEPASMVPIYGDSIGPMARYVSFDANSSALDEDAHRMLAVVKQFFGTVRCTVTLEGHADAAEAFPAALSKKRAEAVQSALVALGVPKQRIAVSARGTKKPAASEPSQTRAERSVRFIWHASPDDPVCEGLERWSNSPD